MYYNFYLFLFVCIAFCFSDIGPFSDAVGIKRHHFEGAQDLPLPIVQRVKNGLVLELFHYLSTKRKMSGADIARKLIALTVMGCNVELSKVKSYVVKLVDKQRKIKRNVKGEAKLRSLSILEEEEFAFIRANSPRTPDTPRKKKLRNELIELKAQGRGTKRKLAVREAETEKLKKTVEQQASQLSCLQQEIVEHFDKENETLKLSADFHDLQEKYTALLDELATISADFDPGCDKVEIYKKKYAEKEHQVEVLEKNLLACQEKLSKVNTRNVNKRIRRRDERVKQLEEKNTTLEQYVQDLEEELQTSKEQLVRTKETAAAMETSVSMKSNKKRKIYQKFWYQKRQRQRTTDKIKTLPHTELDAVQERVNFLEQRVKELECLIALDADEVKSFEDGRFTDSIRRTIMELLSCNVSMNKVNTVIRTVLKNLAGKTVTRLPSAGTRSRLSLEANRLANIEVALAMSKNQPEDAIGNCIHGDGTTKHHRKYQNFQVTLPDGSSRTIAMVEMGAGDTDAVMESFEEQIHQLASTLSHLDDIDKSTNTIYKELITTIKATMTDQGPTMPQFNQKLDAIRQELLPHVVKNWDDLPDDVRSCIKDFGSFYCKMHPLVNFAEEVDKVLKSFEDISTSGRHAHTLQTSESGVTRLVRTSSKAFHHRGCDKSGVEDVFTAFLDNAHGVSNHLVDYIGNRANILFEGGAAMYFHVHHIQEFLAMLANKNNLLLAVEEDVNERLYVAELRALGLFYKTTIEPLWTKIKTAENIFAVNHPLHQLQLKLTQWKEDASPLLTGDSPFDIDKSDEVTVKLLEPSDPESEVMTIQALELICCGVLLILQRQCKDQLPGGKYWDPPKQMSASFQNVPSTNLIGERDFAQLDMLVRQKPSARLVALEAIIMWTNNKLPDWLDNLSDDDRSKYMKAARQCSSEVLHRYTERKKRIKVQKWEALQKSNQKRKEKEEKKMKSTASLVNEIVVLGGVWSSREKVDEEIQKMEMVAKSNEQIRRAIHTQLTFMQKVLQCKAPSKEHFQLSHQQKPFTWIEMKQHLIEVIQCNNIDSDVDAPTLAAQSQSQEKAKSTLEYTPSEEQASTFEEQKRRLGKKIEEEKKKRAAQTSHQYLEKFMANPDLLVGHHIEHLFVVDKQKMWIKGVVQGISSKKTDALKTVYTIDYEDEEELKQYNLLFDLQKKELIIADKA